MPRARVVHVVAVSLVFAAALAGCDSVSDQVDEAVDDVSGSAAATAIENVITDELQRRGITLQSGPDCTPDVNRDGATLTGTVGCIATTSDGKAVAADFTGSLSSSGCEGTVVVTVGEETVLDEQAPEGCQISG
jgi:hypothetical protein